VTGAARPLVIVGAGGHGRETLDVVEAINAVEPRWEVLGFAADDADADLLARRGVPLLGPPSVLADLDAAYVIGVGDGAARRRLDDRLTGWGRHPAVLVHPLASTGSDVRLGPGVVLAAGARVTTNVTLGRHTQLNVAAVVSHDAVVGDHVTLSPGVLVNGNARIDDGAFLGTAAVVLPGRVVGAGAIVGAGAVVIDDVAPAATVVGVPARAVDPASG
jgi:sugar O-acyltransferase (sialic acid O-acetyltransferase NeuD family)